VVEPVSPRKRPTIIDGAECNTSKPENDVTKMYRVGAWVAPGEFLVLNMAHTADEAREFAHGLTHREWRIEIVHPDNSRETIFDPSATDGSPP
jgi:hypothetical protein